MIAVYYQLIKSELLLLYSYLIAAVNKVIIAAYDVIGERSSFPSPGCHVKLDVFYNFELEQ